MIANKEQLLSVLSKIADVPVIEIEHRMKSLSKSDAGVVKSFCDHVSSACQQRMIDTENE